MATSDWLRSFDFDRVFWSTPDKPSKGGEEGNNSGVASEQATQQSVFKGLGEKIVEEALNVSRSVCPRSVQRLPASAALPLLARHVTLTLRLSVLDSVC